MSPAELSPAERDCYNQVCEGIRGEIHPNYATFFNVLRFCQSANFDAAKATQLMRRALRFRREYNLDEGECLLKREPLLEEYAPWTVLRENRKRGDRVVVIERAGMVDTSGLFSSVEATQFMHQRYRWMENLYSIMNEQEARNGTQSHVYFIFDLDGLSFDPSLVSFMNGPFRLPWVEIAMYYREWLDKFIVVNAPHFTNWLWSAISPLINDDDFMQRIIITSSNGQKDLLELIDAECLPQKYGGTLSDAVLQKPRKVPKERYWKPRKDYPDARELLPISVPAGKRRTLSFEVEYPCIAHFFLLAPSQITMSITRTTNKNMSEEEEETFWPAITRAGVPAMDSFRYRLDCAGFYHVHFVNDNSWLFATNVKCLIFLNEDGENRIPVRVSLKTSKVR